MMTGQEDPLNLFEHAQPKGDMEEREIANAAYEFDNLMKATSNEPSEQNLAAEPTENVGSPQQVDWADQGAAEFEPTEGTLDVVAPSGEPAKQ